MASGMSNDATPTPCAPPCRSEGLRILVRDRRVRCPVHDHEVGDDAGRPCDTRHRIELVENVLGWELSAVLPPHIRTQVGRQVRDRRSDAHPVDERRVAKSTQQCQPSTVRGAHQADGATTRGFVADNGADIVERLTLALPAARGGPSAAELAATPNMSEEHVEVVGAVGDARHGLQGQTESSVHGYERARAARSSARDTTPSSMGPRPHGRLVTSPTGKWGAVVDNAGAAPKLPIRAIRLGPDAPQSATAAVQWLLLANDYEIDPGYADDGALPPHIQPTWENTMIFDRSEHPYRSRRPAALLPHPSLPELTPHN